MHQINTQFLLRICTVLIVIFLCFMTFYLTLKTAYPFLIALSIAFLINPIIDFLQQKLKLPRAFVVFLTLLSIISIFIGLISLLIVEIVSGANYLSNNVPKQLEILIQHGESYIENTILPFYEKISALFSSLESEQQATIIENIQNAGATFGTTIGDFIQSFFQKIPAIMGWFPNAATVLIFSTMATFFISNDWYRLKGYANQLTPKKVKDSTGTILADLKKALFGFIKAQLTLISFTTVIVLIGLLFLRVNYAITIALVIGMIDILPYLGSGAVFVPWIMFEVIVGDMRLAIGLVILYIIVIIQRQLMEPKVLSSSIGLDPLATLISLFVGYKLIGFLGLIVGPVILVLLKTLHNSNVFRDIWRYLKGK